MTFDGHQIESLPNGGAIVTSDGQKTYHADHEAALRHVQRMCSERLQYEARRIAQGGRP